MQQKTTSGFRLEAIVAGSDDDEAVTNAIAEAVGSDSRELPAAWIDVTIPLRFQVTDSKLTFHKASPPVSKP